MSNIEDKTANRVMDLMTIGTALKEARPFVENDRDSEVLRKIDDAIRIIDGVFDEGVDSLDANDEDFVRKMATAFDPNAKNPFSS